MAKDFINGGTSNRTIFQKRCDTNSIYQCQMVISYESPNSVSVELWNAPEVFGGRTVYDYDQSGNAIHLSAQVDS